MKPSAPFALLTAVAFLSGCKGETKYIDKPETLASLKDCNAQLAEKDKLIKLDADRILQLERDAAQPGEFVVTIEGDALTIKPGSGGGGGGQPQVDDETAKALTADFLSLVQKSRGAIQKCYEQALKKNTGLQAKTVTLKLSASFAAAGTFQRTSFNPSLGDTFDNCLRGVAGKWKLTKPAPRAMTFQANVSLVPA
jgi:hypothetical protein